SILHSTPIGGLGDLMRAVSLPDVRAYRPDDLAFAERCLRQHSKVTNWRRLDDRRYKVSRKDLRDVTALFLNAYDVTADEVRTAREGYGDLTMVVMTNPNARATSAAHATARTLGCKIYDWRAFLGALNRR